MSWKDFRDQANQDFESSKALMREGDFGNSAYLLQQCTEKYVKAVIFKFSLFNGTAEELGHLPLVTLWKELRARTDSNIRSSRSPAARQRWSELKAITGAIHSFFKSAKGDLSEAVWKDSLKIPLTGEEDNKMDSLKDDLEQKIKPMCNKTGRDCEELFHKVQPFIKYMRKKDKKTIQDFLESMRVYTRLEKIEWWSLAHKETDAIKTPEEISAALEWILKKTDPRANNAFYKDDLVPIIRLSWIITLSGPILKTFPHESIGRYPREINGVNSRLLYQQHSDALVRLSSEVEAVCKKLGGVLPAE